MLPYWPSSFSAFETSLWALATAASSASSRLRALKTSLAVTKWRVSSGSMRSRYCLSYARSACSWVSRDRAETDRIVERLDLKVGQCEIGLGPVHHGLVGS